MTQDILELAPSIREKWPFAPRYARVNGWRMHYVDEGDGDPVLLLHGNPTWGFLYRDVIGPLVQSGRRIIVPDMIGFGLSQKPTREHAHTLDGHTANLVSLVRQLGLTRVTVVCHDWGGPTGLSFAMSDPTGSSARRHEHLGVAAPAGRVPHARVSVALDARAAGRPYPLGRHNALAGRGVYLSVVNRDKFRREAQSTYEAVLPDFETRLLTWVWPRWIPLDDSARAFDRFAWLEQELAKSRLPTMIVWGREDEVFDAATFASRFKQLLPHAEGPHLVTGRHFLQEDSGYEIAGLIRSFLDRLDQRGG